MAKQTITKLIDDISGGAADETIKFAYDGVEYEIDLSTKNANALRAQLEPYLYGARKVGKSATSTRGRGGDNVKRLPTAQERELRQQMRTWLRDNGWTVPDRGRISAELENAYETRTKGPNATQPARKGTKKAGVPAAEFTA